MIKNKRVIFIILIVLLTILNVFLVLKKDTSVIEKSKVIKVERKEFNIYKEQTTGKKDYVSVSDATFPTSGYLLNTTKSVCKSYNDQNITPIPIVQELTKGSINGLITVNSNKTIYCDLYFDKDNTAPVITKFDITGKTSTGANLTNGFTYQYENLAYELTYSDTDVVQYCFSDTSNCTDWKEISTKPTTININSTDGKKTKYVYIKDKANNVSAVKTKEITVDRTKPVISTFTLTGVADTNQTLSSSADYTHKTGIKYNASITETNMEGYCIYEGSSCSYNSNTSTTITNQSYILVNSTEGNHTVNFKVKDKAGNESTVSSKTIKLDTQNPTAIVTSGSVTTDSITVTVSGTDTIGISKRECQATNGSEIKKGTADTNGSCTMSVSKDGTTYTVIGIVTDKSGRVTNSSSLSIATKKKETTGSDLYNSQLTGLTVTDCNGMKRFVGQCDAANGGCDNVVKNFVCFGYNNVSQCKEGITNNEYIYRIIGITEAGEIKLIKNKALSISYKWHPMHDKNVPWNASSLYNSINGSDFLTSLFDDWQDKIIDHSWPLGDLKMNDCNEAASLLCLSENSLKTDSAKIGLMTVSDYYYANSGSDSNCFRSSSEDCSKNWLYVNNNGAVSPSWMVGEWLMIGQAAEEAPFRQCLYIMQNSKVWRTDVTDGNGVARPIFYLSSEALIIDGEGTSTDPFVIAP